MGKIVKAIVPLTMQQIKYFLICEKIRPNKKYFWGKYTHKKTL